MSIDKAIKQAEQMLAVLEKITIAMRMVNSEESDDYNRGWEDAVMYIAESLDKKEEK